MPMAAFAGVELVRMLARPIVWRCVTVRTAALAGLIAFSNLSPFGYRPPHHEYMLFSFAGACAATGRQDLMAEAVAEIEQALAETSYPHMLHPWAMTCLFEYYYGQGNLEKSSLYGKKLLDRAEAAQAPVYGALLRVFTKTGERDEAKRALQGLATSLGGSHGPLMADALLAYGRAFQDEGVLRQARELYGNLTRQSPANSTYQAGLEESEKALKSLGRDDSRDETRGP
jgi:tetratricopeptide (TPR) repeat protein